ncbi:MAG: hypothetical protein ABJG47_17280 [Ekhidna sp.]
MEAKEIRLLLKSYGKEEDVQLIETHISWVILTQEFAFKFKKPIRYSFLNYFKLARRKYYCEREVELNSRYSNIYLGVVPIYRSGKKIQFEEGEEIIDYGVKMKRINSDFQMDRMIEEDLVTTKAIGTLAKTIAQFHHNAKIIRTPVSVRNVCQKFNDILSVKNFLYRELGIEAVSEINEAILESNHYINSSARLLHDRIKYGFIRDVHGDLHAKNIFLLKEPILFDCIEFNDEFRQIDVLDEIAFLCMDLDAKGKEDLCKDFVTAYLNVFPIISNKDEERLFSYYKCYRANVRAKVNALKAKQAQKMEDKQYFLEETKKYLQLMSKYVKEFTGSETVEVFEIIYDYNQLFT